MTNIALAYYRRSYKSFYTTQVMCAPGVFTRPSNKDNTFKRIYLKRLNEFIEHYHFKMNSIYHDVMKPEVYITTVDDIKDAFHTIPIYKEHTKFLKFYHGSFYEFLCIPNVDSEVIGLFTKVQKKKKKKKTAHLRVLGHVPAV